MHINSLSGFDAGHEDLEAFLTAAVPCDNAACADGKVTDRQGRLQLCPRCGGTGILDDEEGSYV